MAKLLLVNDRGEEQLLGAKVAEAQLELLQIRSVRAQMMKAVNLESCDPRTLARLLALDRYGHSAHTKRRRPSYKLLLPGTRGANF